jgi:hypothetical protein
MNLIIYFIVVGYLLNKAYKSKNTPNSILRGVEKILLIGAAIVFTLIWGGIFWW